MKNAILKTTATNIAGLDIASHWEIAGNITVRSRSLLGSTGIGIQPIFKGNLSIYGEL